MLMPTEVRTIFTLLACDGQVPALHSLIFRSRLLPIVRCAVERLLASTHVTVMLLQRHRHILFTGVVLLTFVFCMVLYANLEVKIAKSGLIYHWRSGILSSNHPKLHHTSNGLSTSDPPSTLSSSGYGLHDDDYTEVSRHDDSPALAGVITSNGQHDDLNSQPGLTSFASSTHHELFSQSTADGRYFFVSFGEKRAMNPNIIPHSTKVGVWFIVAQHYKTPQQNWAWFTELVCEATFQAGDLKCLDHPMILPIASTSSPHCSGDIDFYDAGIGPHDARVFHGPDRPYIIYGSQSQYSCFGLWMQDFRRLVDWSHDYEPVYAFRHATDMQRPAPYGTVEKNWFVFWDLDGQIYAHYDIYPQRAFARLSLDGSIAEDLTHLSGEVDSQCMKRMMGPDLATTHGKFHQATNSLSITMCVKADPECKPSAGNTFVVTIFQKKVEINLHSVYEPYVMLFKQASPFSTHAFSTKPIWIHGRRAPGEHKTYDENIHAPIEQSEMLYVTSMSWKDSSRRYHGYLDDIVFLAFGIEDSQAGAIDVLASDLLAGVEQCSNS